MAEFLEKISSTDGEKANMIIVSGIPGSGKHKFAESLARALRSEGVANTVTFKMDLEDQFRFSTNSFAHKLIGFY